MVEWSNTTRCKRVAFGLRGFESLSAHHKRTKRLFGSQKVGRAKRVPLISPHFSKRIRSPAFGGADCFFDKEEIFSSFSFTQAVKDWAELLWSLFAIFNNSSAQSLGKETF